MNNTFNVDKAFILEAYKAACNEWKNKLRKQFPEVFKVKKRNALKFLYIEWEKGIRRVEKHYEFAIGDMVKVNDGSYNEDFHGKNRHGIDHLFEKYAKVIAVNSGKTMFSKPMIHNNNLKVTLNLLLQFPSGELVYCAPNCVKLMEMYEDEVDMEFEEDKW